MMLHTYHPHPTNVPTKYQLRTPYGFWDIPRTRYYRSRSLRQGHRSNQGHYDIAHLYSPTNVAPNKYQLPTPYSFRDTGQTRFYRSRSLGQGQRVKSRSHYNAPQCTPTPPHPHPPTNVPTKYQLPTPYGFWHTALTNFFLNHLDTIGENNTLRAVG